MGDTRLLARELERQSSSSSLLSYAGRVFLKDSIQDRSREPSSSRYRIGWGTRVYASGGNERVRKVCPW